MPPCLGVGGPRVKVQGTRAFKFSLCDISLFAAKRVVHVRGKVTGRGDGGGAVVEVVVVGGMGRGVILPTLPDERERQKR